MGLTVLAACGGKAKSSDDTLPPEPKTTTTTAKSYDVPATIDQAYVQKVMQALDHVYGDAVRDVVKTRKLDAKFQALMVSIYEPHDYQLTSELWAKEIAGGLADMKPEPGDPVTTVTRLIRTDPTCVVAAVTKDFQPLHSVPAQSQPNHFIALVPVPADHRSTVNPTPWRMAYDRFRSDGTEPSDPCRGE